MKQRYQNHRTSWISGHTIIFTGVKEHGPDVLYISYDGMTDALGQSQVIPYLKKLAREFRIHLLSFEKEERLKRRGEAVRKELEASGIEWRTSPFSSGMPVLPKLVDRRRMISMAKQWHGEKNFDLVHCRSYVAAEAGWKLKKETGVRFLFDMRGFWVDERVEGGLWDQRNPVYRLAYKRFKNLEKKFLRDADGIVCLTAQALSTLTSWGVDPGKVSLIRCAADLQHFYPPAPEQRIAGRAIRNIGEERKVIVYLGSLGTWYMLEEMLDFFNVLRSLAPSLFLFLTPDDPEIIRHAASRKQIPAGEIIIREAERDEVPRELAAADAGIFFIRPTFSKTASSPTKLGEMLACGIPVIANSGVGDVDEVLSEYGGGIIVKELNADGYRKAAALFAGMAVDPKRIRSIAEQLFDLDQGVELYRDAYKKCLR
ncbi:MAG: glycosyltransferase [Bacteroidia bacterium]|nr:glycosyltransferase [Bacteroidia bacterium]